MWRRTAGALVLVLLATGASADPVSDGLAAWHEHDYAAARTAWQTAADAGDAQAMFLLAELYTHGKGVPADPAQAMHWLQASARGGYAPACYNLGDRYLNGNGVQADATRAAYWWRQAAVRGLVQAQYNLATLYYRGLGVPVDRGQAAWWYQQAADAGSVRARQALATLRDEGVTLPSDPVTTMPPAEVALPGPSSVTPVPAPGPTEAEARFPRALGAAWLRRQPPDHFTLQVFASHDAGAVGRFLDDYRFSRQVAVYRFHKADGDWFGVTYGRFPSVDAARAALAELPAAVRRGGPWVRAFKDVIGLLAERDHGAG